jgi:hypothetical protein
VDLQVQWWDALDPTGKTQLGTSSQIVETNWCIDG